VEAWRSDVVCTTFVQVVNALFHGTCADARRLTKLTGSILILDEVQAFPAELWAVLRVALRSLAKSFGTDILLVTATQPALFTPSERTEIGPPELLSQSGAAFDRYDVICDIDRTIQIGELAAAVLDELTNSGEHSGLVILNTVREALDLQKHLAETLGAGGFQVFHLSTNLRPKDRHVILSRIRAYREPHVLVATQVVEAGVDLSFDIVFRALAPLDAIVQAAGRCNRHAVGRRGIVRVFDLVGSTANLIYGDVQIGTVRDVIQSAVNEASIRMTEPVFRHLVDEFFKRLNNVIGSDKAQAVFEAVGTFQFGALRGDSVDKNVETKTVRLIEDQFDRVPHFIETDDSDREVWVRFCKALNIPDRWDRRQRLRAIRNELGKRVVEVPRRDAFEKPDKMTGFVHIPLEHFKDHYDLDIGWRRRT
jgi:CRISPR-associated endonuclease/helicase Cas3